MGKMIVRTGRYLKEDLTIEGKSVEGIEDTRVYIIEGEKITSLQKCPLAAKAKLVTYNRFKEPEYDGYTQVGSSLHGYTAMCRNTVKILKALQKKGLVLWFNPTPVEGEFEDGYKMFYIRSDISFGMRKPDSPSYLPQFWLW